MNNEELFEAAVRHIMSQNNITREEAVRYLKETLGLKGAN